MSYGDSIVALSVKGSCVSLCHAVVRDGIDVIMFCGIYLPNWQWFHPLSDKIALETNVEISTIY